MSKPNSQQIIDLLEYLCRSIIETLFKLGDVKPLYL